MLRGTTLPDPLEIDAILFDAGGVLLLPDSTVGRRSLLELGYETTDADWHLAYYKSNLVLDEMEGIDWTMHRRSIALALGVEDELLGSAVPLIEELLVKTPWVAVDGAARSLQLLSDSHYQLGVVSNGLGTVEEELEAAGVCSVNGDSTPRVGVIVDSFHVGLAKPDSAIFQLALDALGVPPERSIFVGDTVRSDVKGAIATGMFPVHVDPSALCEGDHAHIVDLTDLTEWCSGLELRYQYGEASDE